jgi:hypothetical protein
MQVNRGRDMQEEGVLRCMCSVVSGSSSLHTDLSSDIPLAQQGNKAVFAGGEQVRRMGAKSTLSDFYCRCSADLAVYQNPSIRAKSSGARDIQ